ncbi:MAG: aminotransferase class I/II-fold pyridoxal phosphate-dependent enzyme [Saprospiraceae bacterium]|nr:aminotransferase class I/II-fold pyridoxal phosphate-dependent enzyme [Saprospiraceae bacterium]
MSQQIHPHQTPVYATAAFEFDQLTEGTNAFLSQPGTHVYSRYGNPTVEAVAESIANLEGMGVDGQTYAVMTGSGMAAIHLVVQALCRPGDVILTQEDLYGGTTELFFKLFKPFGVDLLTSDFAEEMDLTKLLNKFPIRLIYLETPTNPMLNCVDLEMVCQVATKAGVMVVVDNTFNTPYITRPLALGADLVIHSTTKFIHGHGYSTGGVVVGKSKELIMEKIWTVLKLNGSILSPFEAMLIQIGVKTLGLRIKQQSFNANQLAKYFQEHPKVKKVNYPGLPTHPHHRIAQKQMNAFGAMLSFELDLNLGEIESMLSGLGIGRIAPSLGEAETMIMHPASMSHLRMPEDQKKKFGITEGLIRLSIGLEDVEDQLDAWDSALRAV